jgi:hypothetical protein
MILIQWATIVVTVILPWPTTSAGPPQLNTQHDFSPSITFETDSDGGTQTVQLGYYYHAETDDLMWGELGTVGDLSIISHQYE